MNEKQQIEKATAEGFLNFYNRDFGTDFMIVKLGNSGGPIDVKCQNSKGDVLNLQITMTEDRPGDIIANLSRSDHLSLEILSKDLDEGSGLRSSSLEGNVLDNVITLIKKKLLDSYDPSTALIVRDTSGVDWDWDCVIDKIKREIAMKRNPFDKGIWIINNAKTKLYRVG